MPSICYICAHCGTITLSMEDISTPLDAGMTLTCAECNQHTVIDLDTPEARAARYQAAEAAQAPDHEMVRRE